MHCDDARNKLFDRLDDPHPHGPVEAELDHHLAGCEDCRALRDDILDLQSRTQVWHELQPPLWNRRTPLGPQATPAGWAAMTQQWFPVLASAATLLLAAGIYWRGDVGPPPATVPAPAVQTTPSAAAPDDGWLNVAREERRQEMAALTALLKAEMDRRSLETEQSLKYLVSHQIRSQHELDAMRGKLERAKSASEQL